MGKIFRIGLLLAAIVLSFYSLSFGEQEAQGISPTNSSNELVHGQWILQQKAEAPFSSPQKEGLGRTPNGAKPSKTIKNREFPMIPEIINTMASPVTTEIQARDLSHCENSQLSKGKSSYHFGKIHLTKNNLAPSLDFISSLFLAQHKEENPPSWTLEKLKENGLFKSLAIFLELKLKF